MAKALVVQKTVTEREFVELCKLAVRHIDSGRVPLFVRSDMALYIANIWLRHDNISDRDLLGEIGGQFSEWDIEGSFTIEQDLTRRYWEDVKKWLAEADEKFPKA